MRSTIKLMPQKFNIMKLIKTDEDYKSALIRLESIFDAQPGTPEGDELELLGVLIENYEDMHYPISYPDPIEAIKFRMEQMGYNQADLAKVVGLKSRVSEILNKKRKLSIDMIRKLNLALGIPTDVLIQKY